MVKVNAISLNQTSYFNLKDEDKSYIKEVRATFAYNPESCTHLCELTPSYELRYLHTYIVWDGDPDDDKRAELEERYCHEGDEDTYMHCWRIKHRQEDIKECGEFDSMEDACEYLNGNWPF